MEYITNDDNDTTGRVKGSSKDRVIEFFYRKRYKVKLSKKYNKGKINRQMLTCSPKLRTNVFCRVNTISDLKLKGLNYIKVDPNTEQFDFNKYDYYVIKPKKRKGIGPEKKIESVKPKLSKLNNINAKGLDYRIKDTKKLVNDTKSKLNKVKVNLEYPVLPREELSKMYNDIRENINDLKYEYEILKGETDNRSYAFEEAINIMDQIGNYDKQNIQKMNDMLSVATLELNRLSINNSIKNKKDVMENDKKIDIKEEVLDVNLYNKPVGVDEGIDDEQTKQEYVDKVIEDNVVKKEEKLEKEEQQDIQNSTMKEQKNSQSNLLEQFENIDKTVTIKLSKEDKVDHQKLQEIDNDVVVIKSYEEKIAYELQRQKEIIHNMYKKVGKVSKEVTKTYEITGYSRMVSSLGNIAVGMLTLPLTPIHIMNLSFGSKLINKGVKNLKKGLDTKEKITVDYKYEDLSSEIKKEQKDLGSVNSLITNSVDELEELRIKFIQEFSQFQYQIPDYTRTLKGMDNLKYKLLSNQKQIDQMDNNLTSQAEKNKVMVKKIDKLNNANMEG